MIKVIDTYGMRLEEIEDCLNRNSSWKLISFGNNYYRTNGMGLCVPPRTMENCFMVVESIGDDVKEFEL